MRYIKYEVDKKTSVRKFLREKDFSKRSIDEILVKGYFVNDKLSKKSQELETLDKISIIIEDEDLDYKPIKGNIKIVYEDESTLVVSKNANLTVNSKNQVSLANYLSYYFKENNINSKIRLVNRLDMDTSGLMIIAKNKFAHAFYQRQIESNKMEKKYLAVIEGRHDINIMYEEKFSYDELSKSYKKDKSGKSARTIFRTISNDENKSLIECKILTGKTHQIRASLSELGYPIIGDKLYGSEVEMDRFLLHSYKLSFFDFDKKENINLEDWPNFISFYQK
ncbi:RluA family pseudouridine synthase [uncultured Anaerococcus sp.]|uniref:RluA family pseudouridine synthase n=1 Tax=uncultured Anaerococcus sp. TaxID=293428 RepID=UPI002630B95D|nr:RluA family pseudouridine synthase [uncultured Anaerococcus sp.]